MFVSQKEPKSVGLFKGGFPLTLVLKRTRPFKLFFKVFTYICWEKKGRRALRKNCLYLLRVSKFKLSWWGLFFLETVKALRELFSYENNKWEWEASFLPFHWFLARMVTLILWKVCGGVLFLPSIMTPFSFNPDKYFALLQNFNLWLNMNVL